MKIENMLVSDIIPYMNNAKEHPKHQIEQIVNSIREFGFNDPIAIDEHNVIIEGHGRLEALKLMGINTVDCIRLSHLTEEQKRAYIIAHNKLTMNTGFNMDIILEELEFLTSNDFDTTLTGFDTDELADILHEDKEVVDDDFDIILPEEAKSQLGDLWILGRHRLLCGDSTTDDVYKLMDEKLADMIFTDPPWNVNYGADQNHPSWKPRTIKNDHMSTESFNEFLMSAFNKMSAVSKNGAMTYVVMSPQEWANVMNSLFENDYHWSSTIIWNKDRIVLSRKDYHTKYEPIWYGWKNGSSRLCPLLDRKQSDVWDFERPSKSEEHPTMKPIPLVAKTITNSSKLNDIVLDLFGGSGTTLIASEQTDRICYMMELDPKYVDVIVNRYFAFTEDEHIKLIRDGVEYLYEDIMDGE